MNAQPTVVIVGSGPIGSAYARLILEGHPEARVACLGLAFKANIDDFRESPARLVASTLTRRHSSRISIVEPYISELPIEYRDTPVELIDIDTALERCDILIVLVDHDLFRSIPLSERVGKIVYDTRGIWPDQPRGAFVAGPRLMAVG